MEDRRSFLKQISFYMVLFAFILSPLDFFRNRKYKLKLTQEENLLINKARLIIKEKYKEFPLWNQTIILNENYKPLFSVNETAYWIWNKIDNRKGFQEIKKDFLREYDVDEKIAVQDLTLLLGQLWKKRLINFS